jgi:hypothetical protein
MYFIRKVYLFAMLTLFAVTAFGDLDANKPQIAYLYPAGGQQGKVVVITAGGQFLRGAKEVYVSGEGVSASVIKYIKPFPNLNPDRRKEVQDIIKIVWDKRIAELPAEMRPKVNPKKKQSQKTTPPPKKTPVKSSEAKKSPEAKKAPAKKQQPIDHPLFYDIENKSLRELEHLSSIVFVRRSKLQPNRQLAESVLIEVTIDADAKPGSREIRLNTAVGMTKPIIFQVGLLPEKRELEPNNTNASPKLVKVPKLPVEKPLTLPVVLNGQIMPGDIDRFRFIASKGQKLVIETQARSLIPYLADAVPGWFQATVTLYDASGHEVAYADDYRFNPDPVLFYEIKTPGIYELQICDSIYRGRDDFVYRIAISEQPFITEMFPLGGKSGNKTIASIDGWNLPEKKLTLDTSHAGGSIQSTAYYKNNKASNPVAYAVDTLSEIDEGSSNDTITASRQISLPTIINGRIDSPGDVDVFRFKAVEGDEVTAEVYARKLNSPLDSLLRLTDSKGKVIGWNDDYMVKEGYLHKDITGLTTHHADSYLTAKLPKSGTYYIHLTDSQNHGGKAYGYRLRVSAPQPDFALRVTPSSLNLRGGFIVPVSVHVLRKDGFDGPVEVRLDDAPKGFILDGGVVPAGNDRVRMTLRAPLKSNNALETLKLSGHATIGGESVIRNAVAADDVMQAFLYRHLVPSEELVVRVVKSRWGIPPIKLVGQDGIVVAAGETVKVKMKAANRKKINANIKLALYQPPDGITMENVKVLQESLSFDLKVDKETMAAGYEGNLIFEAFTESMPKTKDGKPTGAKRKNSMGVIPAVPIKVAAAKGV